MQIEKQSHALTSLLKAFLQGSGVILTKFRTRNREGAVTVLLLSQGYIASRLLSRRACYILKMNRQTTPSLEQLKQSIYETKVILEYPEIFLVLEPGNTGVCVDTKRVREQIIILYLTVETGLNILKCFTSMVSEGSSRSVNLISTIQPPI